MAKDYFNVVNLMTIKVFSFVFKEIQQGVFTAASHKGKFFPLLQRLPPFLPDSEASTEAVVLIP